MSNGVTLTAAMRANLYSLQQTSQLMGTIQNRLSTGKKVNSALDNPNNYFSAQSLTNRASDLSNLLDGMGQAIQAITQASDGITSAQKIVDQMKAVANSAIQSATTSGAGATQPVVANGPVDSTALIAANGVAAATTAAMTAGASSGDSVHLLTNLTNNATGASLGIVVGQQLTMAGSGGTATFTVTATSTLKDLQTFMESSTTLAAVGGVTAVKTAINASGDLYIGVTGGATPADDVTMGGALATALGVASAAAGDGSATVAGTVALGVGPSALADTDKEHRLTALTDANGVSLGIANGDKLTYQLGTGQVLTFTVGAAKASPTTGANLAGVDGGGTTMNDLQAWLALQGTSGHLTTSAVSAGKLAVTNNDTTKALVLGGSIATTLGLTGSIASGAGVLTATTKAYSAPQSVVPQATGSTLLRDLSAANGDVLTDGAAGTFTANALQAGSTVTVSSTSIGKVTINVTDGMTVQNLLDQINKVDSKLNVSINTAGKLVVDNQTANAVTFGGNGGAQLFNADPSAPSAVATNAAGAPTTIGVTLYAGFSPKPGTGAGASTLDASKATQFDTLRTQLDELVGNSSYQGINLISGTGNSPLTVTFDEKATNAAKLVIKSVDLTSAGLKLNQATGSGAGAWVSTADVQKTLATLTDASTTLRTQSASLGTNLSTVQTRQEFTNSMIATLKAGSDSLTLADMNEESANMLALQTRSQLGTQALSLANQANQSVMRLFG